jgi:hypothetical protein
MGRLYVEWKLGETSLLQIKATYKEELINTAEYLSTKCKEDLLLILLKTTKAFNQMEFYN